MRRALLGLLTVVLVVTAAGCGLLAGQDPGADQAAVVKERAVIRLGTMPVVDSAPLHIALQKGYFRDEGVDVELTTIPGGAAGIPALVNGELDVTFGNWVSFLAAQATGTADLRLVADAYRAKPQTLLVLAAPDSPVRASTDLAGKRVAVNTRSNVSELAVLSAMRTEGVDASGVQFVELPYPEMEGALQRKDVDAALVVEPYISRAQRQIGAITVLDTITGPTEDLAISGYAAGAAFAKDNPKTLDAFRRALAKAQRDAGERREVETAVAGYAKIDSALAAVLRLGTFASDIDVDRLRKVLDLMRAHQMITTDVDVNAMLLTR